MDDSFLKGKIVLVMGLGRFGGGADSARFASGLARKIIVTDIANHGKLTPGLKSIAGIENIELRLGSHEEKDFLRSDVVIVNPAVPAENNFVKIARKAGKLITSQMEIFFQLCPARIIGITGSNGKSTTTSLIHHLLTAGIAQTDIGYSKVWLGGNIGKMPLLENLAKISAEDLVVLELSSFQLESLGRIRKSPYASCITNLTPNHLDRHGTFEEYCRAKENIIAFQNDGFAVLNSKNTTCRSLFDKYKNNSNAIFTLFDTKNVGDELKKNFKLPGNANLENLAAAIAMADYFGVEKARQIKSLETFAPLRHRLELIQDQNGVKWYNDSISTTPESTIAALHAFDEPKILIAGGYDKELSFAELAEKIVQRTSKAILIGQTAKIIASEIDKKNNRTDLKISMAQSLQEAVQIARKISQPGDVVLLSPACASYDMFENFEQRGNTFRKIVRLG